MSFLLRRLAVGLTLIYLFVGATWLPLFVNNGRAYVNLGTANTSGSGATLTLSVTVVNPSYIVVGIASQNGIVASSITVGSLSLSSLTGGSDGANSAELWGAHNTSLSGVQTVTVTWASGSFNNRSLSVWSLTNLTTNALEAGAYTASPASFLHISVNAGDFLFSSNYTSGASTFASSTQVASDVYSPSATTPFADWTIVSTNATFGIVPNGASAMTAAVTFR